MKKAYGFLIFLSLFFLNTPRAFAVLGGSADSVSSDEKVLSATHRNSMTHEKFSTEELVSNSVTVREYVSPSGVVFGLAWSGRVHPDLTQLLGSYTGEYQKALSQTPKVRGRRHQKVTSANTVVEKWGHMRNLQGRAYVPSLLPDGVTADDIQ